MSDKHPPAFQFYPKDFTSDGVVEAMTTEEVGSYILLLCKAWYEKPVGSIPDNDQILARWTRLDIDRWQACKNNVLAAFTLGTDSRWHQKRLRTSFDNQQRRKNLQVESGKRGAEKRWKSGTSIGSPCQPYSDPNGIPLANDSSSSSSPSSNNPPTPKDGGGLSGCFKELRMESLTDPAALADWMRTPKTRDLPKRPVPSDLPRLLALGKRAVSRSDDPIGLFAHMLAKGLGSDAWDFTGDEYDEAKREVRDWQNSLKRNEVTSECGKPAGQS